ncbi:hypothetical protein FHU29_002967 [Hoyosella altamirensis]|uniref:Uncharacterized protein n=1 Tax=Hoyosella altamirensis TaxID=616997 RepID=A0A839RQJ9_9ACTN|nr:hypothetical protein [Hoyosella altamirensis]
MVAQHRITKHWTELGSNTIVKLRETHSTTVALFRAPSLPTPSSHHMVN